MTDLGPVPGTIDLPPNSSVLSSSPASNSLSPA